MRAIVVDQTGVGSSRPVRVDDFAPAHVTIQGKVTGTATYTIEMSLDDPNEPNQPASIAGMAWFPIDVVAGVGATANILISSITVPKFYRLTITAGTGTVTMSVLQHSNGPT